MFYILRDIKALLKLDQINIDNIFFRLHYKTTMPILVIFCLLITKKQYFGDPIDCIVEHLPTDMIDKYCWIQSTYTVPELMGAKVGEVVPHPGVFPVPQDRMESVRHHKYYQWVVLFLFLQAGMFYMPRYIWKRWEAGRVERLVCELYRPIVSQEKKQQRIALAVEYFTRYFHLHNLYIYQFITCEILNLLNVVGQIYLTDRFLGYGFLEYGPRVLSHLQDENTPTHYLQDEIFPKVAKCVFHKFGPSGTIMRHDALCVLPLNILNEKIFAFVWYWLILVTVATVLGLMYRLATLMPEVRRLLLRGRSRLADGAKVDSISRKCYVGDWFMLYLLAKNMDAFAFKEFIDALTVKLVEKEHLL
ncbi:hypothetical protein Pmani_024901 [Petrolisthes manimaculis]|uniref:Innexin n=1 Tax=Petrolisthes manimaculis TaxID=1843537 RepID=A0AAE1TY95_9EUCA|nr:hypothetical protein Pmani_024901 [Petrolisthes manimaculis]